MKEKKTLMKVKKYDRKFPTENDILIAFLLPFILLLGTFESSHFTHFVSKKKRAFVNK